MSRRAFAVAWVFAWMWAPGCTRNLFLPAAGDGTLPEGTADAGTVTDGSRSPQDRFAATDVSASADGRDGPFCRPHYDWFDTKDTVPTDVTLVVARNSTMASSFGNLTRIGAVQKVIRDAIAGYPSALNFGYVDFPELLDPACAAGCCVGPAVASSPLTEQQIRQALAPCDQGISTPGCVSTNDNRPMVAAFGAVLDSFSRTVHGVPASGPRSVILFADNGPGCGGESPPKACADLKDEVIMLAQQTKTITTYVIPIGLDVNCLNNIAMVGSTVLDPDQLASRLTSILFELAKPYCSIGLNQEPRNKANVQVLMDGVPVPRDDSGTGNGWSFHSGSSVLIDVHGTSCAALQQVSANNVFVREQSSCQQ